MEELNAEGVQQVEELNVEGVQQVEELNVKGAQQVQELNVEGVQQVAVVPNTVDLLENLTDSMPLVSVGFTESSPDGHNRHLSEDLSSLTINNIRVNGEESCDNQSKGNGISFHGHNRNFSEDIGSLTINELRASKVEEDCHSQHEEKEQQISRHNSAERNIFKAAEIAERFIQALDNRVLVETAAPIESVKDAVSKFGGILDWKERRKNVQLALDKVREEGPEYQRRVNAEELEKSKVLQELCSTRRIIEGLKLSLEKAQTEALQAQQDAELAEIRYKEIQQGIARKESAAVKAEIDLAKERHATAVADLQSVKEELEQLEKEHTSLITHREIAEIRAHESTAASQEIEKIVEDLTLELISLKESLTSSHATHIIAEERRINVALAYEQEKMDSKNELKQVDGEIQKLNDEILANKDLESKLEAASALLANLQSDFTAYMEGTLLEKENEVGEEMRSMVDVQMKLAKTRKELEDMRTNIETAKDEVKGLWNTAAALRADLEKEKADLTALKDKVHRATVSASSFQEELRKTTRELIVVQERIEAAKMPAELRQATQETQRAKAKARSACDEVTKAGEEADRAKAEVNVVQLRQEAVSREILAVKASEEIAMASVNALQEYKEEGETEPEADRRSDKSMMVSLEEYDALNKRAKEAEDLAKKRVIEAVEKIKEAKEGEVRSLDKLYQLTTQIDERRVALREAQEKAIAAQDHKLTMENELRKRRVKHGQHYTAGEAELAIPEVCLLRNGACSFDAAGSSASHMQGGGGPVTAAAGEPKARKSYFPRSIVTMFMTRKKTHSK
ncbi:protein WEAK CHLOROPLAST MOVEMENT UNDER BLUE LIGHT 1-like [Hordeum vulgare subsp. vulgare]|uniref:Protein WEAK CHLOROPLAST MOVEMENT UNDER BLUE LIGHT 1 n=1 Tax=Hordeum vulgare subsp. vulgare TaxID=112509 RepID=A0A8I6XZD3_HORVV|nr:protein WEAK CHLOROPLAST MOVEMENT UNDER BLUE LIGHT 1-like [Hordeum vulgare subsp. vulgare]